jgi:NitT/TauT family transport system ATP-binding protein
MSLKTMYAATFLTAALVAGALACVSPRPAAAQATKLVYALPTTVPDEPFGSLDAQTRLRMQELLLAIWSEHKKTVLFVTHDIEEAILLSERVLILSSRPAQVREEIVIDLPRPRTHETLTQPACMALRTRIMKSLFDS